MARVSIVKAEDAQWRIVREASPPDIARKLSEGELDSSACMHQPGTEETPQLFEIKFLPGATVAAHAHDQDEIMYVLAGEMHVGTQVLKPGSSLSVPGKTVYGFAAGKEGLHILNFRPRTDFTFHTPEEIRAARPAAPNG